MSTPTLSTEIGQYRVLEELGRGGMGIVYKARHVTLGRLVALKLLPFDRSTDPRAVDRFFQEIRAIGSLDHPHVVQATDAGTFSGVHCLVMEYVDGVDAGHLLSCGPLRVADACRLIQQAALGLQGVADKRLVHRDIKPTNLLVSRLGVVKVADLGLARAFAEVSDSRLTESGLVVGTVDYLAPEQAAHHQQTDIRADVYALGCTLHCLLAGHPPFPGDRYPSVPAKLQAHAFEPPPPLRSIRPDVPEILDQAVLRMLAKKPDDRFQTPSEVADVLDEFTTGSDLARLVARWDSAHAQTPDTSQVIASRHGDTDLAHVAAVLPGLVDLRTTDPESVPLVPVAQRTRPLRRYLALGALGAIGVLVLVAAVVGYRLGRPPLVTPGSRDVTQSGLTGTEGDGEPGDGEPGNSGTGGSTRIVGGEPPAPQSEWAKQGIAPEILQTPGMEGTESLALEPDGMGGHQLAASSDTLRLIKLGELAEPLPSFRFTIDMRPLRWNGICGFFFGYREARDGGRRVTKLQLIQISRTSFQGRALYYVTRSQGRINEANGTFAAQRSIAHRLVGFTDDNPTVRLRIDARGLASLSVGGHDCGKLTSLETNAKFTPEDFLGAWGVFVDENTTWFSNPVIDQPCD